MCKAVQLWLATPNTKSLPPRASLLVLGKNELGSAVLQRFIPSPRIPHTPAITESACLCSLLSPHTHPSHVLWALYRVMNEERATAPSPMQ